MGSESQTNLKALHMHLDDHIDAFFKDKGLEPDRFSVQLAYTGDHYRLNIQYFADDMRQARSIHSEVYLRDERGVAERMREEADRYLGEEKRLKNVRKINNAKNLL